MLLPLVCAAALAFPETDPAEVPVDLTAPADQVGTWMADPGFLALTAGDPVARYNYWLAAETRLGSGVIRARIQVGGKLDSTVIFRATVPNGQPGALSGYGFSFEGHKIGFYRWTDGAALPLGPLKAIPGLDGRAQVEVVLYLIGPHVAAVVLDAQTLEELGVATMHDTAYANGRVGFRAHASQGRDTRLVHLAVLSREVGTRRPTPSEDPWGEVQLATVPASAVDRLSESSTVLTTQGDTARIRASRPEIERLRRAGIQPREVTGYVGKWAEDESFRANVAQPYVETSTGFDVSASYKDPGMVEAILRAAHRRWPEVTDLREVGTTHQGRPIWALRVTDAPQVDEDEPAVLLGASTHGSELLSVEYGLDALLWTLEHQDEPRVRTWISELDLWFVPLVNVDGSHAYWHVSHEAGRKNMRDNDGDGAFELWEGVDLNRNFPFAWGTLGEEGSKSAQQSGYYRGPFAGSEPETRAMMALADAHRWVAAISWHTVSTVIITPYSIEGQPNPEPDVPRGVAEAISATLPRQPNGKTFRVVRNIYAVDGTDQDWYYHHNGTLAYIVEGSHHNPTRRSTRLASIAAVRPFFQQLLDRIVHGPRIAGHVVDEAGAPMEAVVSVDEIVTRNGEAWLSRGRDGRFDRVVLTPGRYTVRARAPGYAPAVQTVEVGQGPASVSLVLPRAQEVE